ncbi:hypothetical protein [Cellulomonas carbonis]|uniref:Leucine-rich repeat domain-containing protein n=1 Tax=Cellulomonas carbonis T26 TaxID=947969 RepID=A0A0A0BXK3_9CELL|nr:hypothetical protein [Cellulomonas carbonis]KGM11894.1 hypothetical protein N868_04980 [Cellulomonas carbonis T26]GGB91424.1 hypothetical protein GCM10010972_00060 [Cellulomonas carbonis]
MPRLASIWDCADGAHLPPVTSVREYQGEPVIAVAATQLHARHTRTQATKIVDEWVEFFSAGPSPITELHFVTRTPKRLFAALAGQTQLLRLFVKWGDYADLSALSAMDQLEVLRLGGASSVRSVEPLADLDATLTHLEIESLRDAHDLSPLGHLNNLVQLDLGGDWMSPRIAHIDSITWLPGLRRLEHLLLHTLIVDDLDYTPLLGLKRLKAVRVMQARGMRPSLTVLSDQLPWST